LLPIAAPSPSALLREKLGGVIVRGYVNVCAFSDNNDLYSMKFRSAHRLIDELIICLSGGYRVECLHTTPRDGVC